MDDTVARDPSSKVVMLGVENVAMVVGGGEAQSPGTPLTFKSRSSSALCPGKDRQRTRPL